MAEVKGMTLSFDSLGLIEALLVYAAQDADRLDSIRVRGEANVSQKPHTKQNSQNPQKNPKNK